MSTPVVTVLCLYAVVLSAGKVFVSGADWFYPVDGEERWPETCKGEKQSPIDITDNEVLTGDVARLQFFNYDNFITAECQNNGHTAMFVVPPEAEVYVTEEDHSRFDLRQIHFHWESEHTRNGERSPLEVHLVHQRHSDDIETNETSLHVLASLFHLERINNSRIANAVNSLSYVANLGETSEVNFIPRSFLPKNVDKFYRYHGSLTTPDCDEIVQWTIFESTVPISLKQYDILRGIETFNGSYTWNFRTTQPLNERQVRLYSSEASLVHPFILLILAMFLSKIIF